MALDTKKSDKEQNALEAEQIATDNAQLYDQTISAYESSESVSDYIRKIAVNLEKLCNIYNQPEEIPRICNRIVVHFRSMGYDKLRFTVYHALSDKGYERFTHEDFTRRSVSSLTDLPEDISIEMHQISEASKRLKSVDWDRYPESFIQSNAIALSDGFNKIQKYQEEFGILDYTKDYDPLDDNEKRSVHHAKRPLEEPDKDETPNCIAMQYQYLIEDIQYFVDEFVKRYYPPERHQTYYARSVYLLRKLFSQYGSDKIHRDLYDWSDILAADLGYHKSGKSAKEISARYGDKIRRYDKATGEPIFGRKGICKEQIMKKRDSLTGFLQQFYHVMPLFMFIHKRYGETKERRLVDHTIDMKPKRQHYS